MRTLLVVVATTALISGCAWIGQSSVSSGSRPAKGNAASSQPSVSQAGRFVAFTSSADNLVPGDTNGVADVFVHDHLTDMTERISVGTDGAQGNAASAHPSISDDGRFVAFNTNADNFSALPSPSELRNHLYVRDRQLATTTRIDAAQFRDGKESGYLLPAISGNGRFLAFVVERTYHEGESLPGGPYVRDLVTGTLKAMPNPSLDASWLFPEIGPSLSDDGSRIVCSTFDPTSGNLPDGFFRFETVAADTATAAVLDTVYSQLLPSDGSSIPRVEPTISGDGKEVALAVTLNGVATISRYDLAAPGLTPLLTGIPDPRGLALSDHGRVLGFRRSSQYVVSTNGGTPRVVSADRLGHPVTAADGALSGDGRWVAFSSADLQLGRDDTNGVDDVFLRSTRPTLFARPR